MHHSTTAPRPPSPKPPRLESGDQLSRPEFERRYAAMPSGIKAELIDGVVYMASPVRHGDHGQPHSRFNGFLVMYMAATPGTDTGDNSSLRLDLASEPQPDCLLRIVREAGGTSSIDDEGYLVGGPELVAEIAASSVSYDLGPKLKTYRRHGVGEYVVWRVQDEEIDWFILRAGDYDRLPPDEGGVIRSEAFPGLWLNVPALLRDDMASVQRTLQQGLAGAEHETFRARLSRTDGGTH